MGANFNGEPPHLVPVPTQIQTRISSGQNGINMDDEGEIGSDPRRVEVVAQAESWPKG